MAPGQCGGGKRLEAGCRRVSEPALSFADLSAMRPCPRLMDAGMQDAESIVISQSERDELTIRECGSYLPDEEVMLGHAGHHKVAMLMKAPPHPSSRLNVEPPTFPVALPLVRLPVR